MRNKVIAGRAPDQRCRAQGGSKGLPEIGAVDDSHAVREEAAFEQTIVRVPFGLGPPRSPSAVTYQAFEVFVLGGCSGAKRRG